MRRSLRTVVVLPLLASMLLAADAQASITLGQTTGATDGCGSNEARVQAGNAAAKSYVAQSSGVVVSWSYLAHANAPTLRFKVYKPTASASTWFLRSQSAQKTPGSGAGQVRVNQLNTFSESPGLRIEAGDHLGLTASGGSGAGCITGAAASDVVRVKALPDTTEGQDNTGFNGNLPNTRVDVSAVVEPDADGDGFGDESQDGCPTDATVHAGPCPVQVSIAKTVGDGAMVGRDLTFTLAVKNNHASNTATDVSVVDALPAGVTFVSSAAGQGSCAGTTSVTCALGALGPGQSTSVTIVVRPTAAGPLGNTASVSTTASDTDSADNSSTAATNVLPLPPVLTGFKVTPASFLASKGTLVSYQLSEDATSTFKVIKRAPGVVKKGRCVKPPKKKPRKKPKACTRLLGLGSYVRQDKAGAVSYRYDGRLNGKTLAPARYRLQVVASNVSGASTPAHANFTIKKKKKKKK